MLFADSTLVARIEGTVTRLLVDCAAATLHRRPEVAPRSWTIAGGAAALLGPGSPFNKLGGLGFGSDAALDEGLLGAVEAEFERRAVPLQIELATLAAPALLATLTRRGYTLVGCEHVLGRALTPGERFQSTPGAEVALGTPDGFAPWLDAVLTGFAVPDGSSAAPPEEFPRDVLAADLSDVHTLEGFTFWRATRRGSLAGGASLRVSDGVAQLYGAATLPEHRRHGVQTALLFARLSAAAALGADLATVTTQPGSKSQHNAQRQGFELLSARTLWSLGGRANG
jgi:GNAT superfamily N-acetyltransferase